MEAAIAFQKLFERFEKLDLVEPAQIAPRIGFREIKRLVIAAKS